MTTLYGAICALICLRIVFYRRHGGRHRPLAAALAYILAIASGTESLRACMGLLPAPNLADTALHAVLLLALLAVKGNVADLFRTADDNIIHRTIRRENHAQW